MVIDGSMDGLDAEAGSAAVSVAVVSAAAEVWATAVAAVAAVVDGAVVGVEAFLVVPQALSVSVSAAMVINAARRRDRWTVSVADIWISLNGPARRPVRSR